MEIGKVGQTSMWKVCKSSPRSPSVSQTSNIEVTFLAIILVHSSILLAPSLASRLPNDPPWRVFVITMQTSQVFASALICVAAVLGDSAPSPTSASPSFTTTPTALADSQIPAKLPELYTPPPERLPQTTSLSGDVTIGITNRLFNTPAVSIVGFSDAGSQPPRKTISGTFSQTTSIVVPSGWAGAFILDKVEAPFDDQGSRIEGNWGIDDPYNQVYLGVSYVAGYSVPIVCSCGTNSSAIPVTGCNKSLFSFGTCSYPQLQYGSTASPVCVNTSPVDGPPETFFKPVSIL